jgi:hypothetical protein
MIAVTPDVEFILQEMSKRYDRTRKAFLNHGSITDFINFYDLKTTINRILRKLPDNLKATTDRTKRC